MILEKFACIGQLEAGAFEKELKANKARLERGYTISEASPEFKPYTTIDKIIIHEIPELLAKHLKRGSFAYGSIGNPNHKRAQIPWVGELDREVTGSVKRNFYMINMLSYNRTRVIQGLACGLMVRNNHYRNVAKEDIIKSRDLSARLRSQIIEMDASFFVHFGEFTPKLGATVPLPRGYEDCFIGLTSYMVNKTVGRRIIEGKESGFLDRDVFKVSVTQDEEDRFLENHERLVQAYSMLKARNSHIRTAGALMLKKTRFDGVL
jgi:MrcB-like, N-terminal domain